MVRRATERDRELGAQSAADSLATFVRQAWEILNPTTPLIWSWHIDAIADHLQAVYPEQRIKRLLINIPPGHAKSLLVSVFWPAWVWLHDPSYSFIFGSYDMALSTRDSIRCRDVVLSDWYRDTFRPRWALKSDQNVKTWFENTAHGVRLSTAVGGRGTGHRADAVIFDDPLNVEEYPSAAKLHAAISWWDHRMSTRLKDPRTGVRVGIMQRLHEDDLAGHCIRKGGYDLLRLPTEFDPDHACSTSIGWSDPRTNAGELLFSQMFGPDEIAEAREDLGEAGFAGQHNQDPAPAGGLMFQRHWFRFWFPAGATEPKPVAVRLEDGTVHECQQRELPDRLDETITSWDFSFGSKSAGASQVCGQAWGARHAERYLLDQIASKMRYTEMRRSFASFVARHPKARRHYIENKAAGPMIIDEMGAEVSGVVPVEPQGDKVARAAACTPIAESGHVYLPHPAVFPWVNDWLHEVTTFPRSRRNDMVDAATQALSQMRRSLKNLQRLRALASRG